MIVEKIEFKHGKTLFQLRFPSNIAVVLGDSGTGKTYLGNALADYSVYLENTGDFSGCTFKGDIREDFCIQYFNYATKNLCKRLQELNSALIVIDNCDIILNQKIKDFINVDVENQYLLFARNTDDLSVGLHSLLLIEHNQKNDVVTFKERFACALSESS